MVQIYYVNLHTKAHFFLLCGKTIEKNFCRVLLNGFSSFFLFHWRNPPVASVVQVQAHRRTHPCDGVNRRHTHRTWLEAQDSFQNAGTHQTHVDHNDSHGRQRFPGSTNCRGIGLQKDVHKIKRIGHPGDLNPQLHHRSVPGKQAKGEPGESKSQCRGPKKRSRDRKSFYV